jgi:hypothetical protein
MQGQSGRRDWRAACNERTHLYVCGMVTTSFVPREEDKANCPASRGTGWICPPHSFWAWRSVTSARGSAEPQVALRRRLAAVGRRGARNGARNMEQRRGPGRVERSRASAPTDGRCRSPHFHNYKNHATRPRWLFLARQLGAPVPPRLLPAVLTAHRRSLQCRPPRTTLGRA